MIAATVAASAVAAWQKLELASVRGPAASACALLKPSWHFDGGKSCRSGMQSRINEFKHDLATTPGTNPTNYKGKNWTADCAAYTAKQVPHAFTVAKSHAKVRVINSNTVQITPRTSDYLVGGGFTTKWTSTHGHWVLSASYVPGGNPGYTPPLPVAQC